MFSACLHTITLTFVMSFLGNLLWLGDGPNELIGLSWLIAALILEIVKIFMNYDLERLLYTENIFCLTSYILCLIWPFAKLQKSV